MIDLTQFKNGALIAKPKFRDFRLENIPADAFILPPIFSLRDKISGIKNQGTSSSCVAQATAYYVQVLNKIETGTDVIMSARDIYSSIYIKPSGGAYIADAMKKICNTGCVVEAEAPSDAMTPPTSEAFMENRQDITPTEMNDGMTYLAKSYVTWDNTNLDFYKRAIVQGNGCVVVTWGNNACFQTANILLPDLPSQMVWRHGIYFIGYDDTKKVFEFVNSWNGWGDNGIGYLPYDYVSKGYVTNPVTLVDAPNTYYFSLLNLIANLKSKIALFLHK